MASIVAGLGARRRFDLRFAFGLKAPDLRSSRSRQHALKSATCSIRSRAAARQISQIRPAHRRCTTSWLPAPTRTPNTSPDIANARQRHVERSSQPRRSVPVRRRHRSAHQQAISSSEVRLARDQPAVLRRFIEQPTWPAQLSPRDQSIPHRTWLTISARSARHCSKRCVRLRQQQQHPSPGWPPWRLPARLPQYGSRARLFRARRLRHAIASNLRHGLPWPRLQSHVAALAEDLGAQQAPRRAASCAHDRACHRDDRGFRQHRSTNDKIAPPAFPDQAGTLQHLSPSCTGPTADDNADHACDASPRVIARIIPLTPNHGVRMPVVASIRMNTTA